MMFMKRVLLIASCLLIAACNPHSEDATVDFPVMPKELSDCKIYWISGKYRALYVVRCPNSTTSTTYRQGKTSATTVVIDGVEYVKREQ